jgi:hypothetical protein
VDRANDAVRLQERARKDLIHRHGKIGRAIRRVIRKVAEPTLVDAIRKGGEAYSLAGQDFVELADWLDDLLREPAEEQPEQEDDEHDLAAAESGAEQ